MNLVIFRISSSSNCEAEGSHNPCSPTRSETGYSPGSEYAFCLLIGGYIILEPILCTFKYFNSSGCKDVVKYCATSLGFIHFTSENFSQACNDPPLTSHR